VSAREAAGDAEKGLKKMKAKGSNRRTGVFLVSALASLAALAGAYLVPRYFALGDDIVYRVIPWAGAAVIALAGAALAAGAASRAARRAASAAEAAATADVDARIVAAERAAEERAASLSGELSELRNHDEARAKESRMAARMQRRIVPRVEDLPSRIETAFGAAYLPAENTGGDLYDAVRMGKNGLALLAADVSGRGVMAALIAAVVKNAFRSRVGWDSDPAALMSAVDAELRPMLEDSGHYVTAFFALLDLETGLLRFVSAGHPPALLLRRRDGAVEELDSTGSPLGLPSAELFRSGERRLDEGDRVLLYTDGLTSSRDYRGESFGRERLVAAFVGTAQKPVSEAAAALAKTQDAFREGAPRSDDLVALVCEFRSHARPEDQERRRASEKEDWRVLARRGSELAAKGKIEEAIGAYERLLEVKSGDATSLNNLGTLYWRMGRRGEAAARFKEASAIDPDDPRIRRNMALAAEFFAAGREAAPAAPPPRAEASRTEAPRARTEGPPPSPAAPRAGTEAPPKPAAAEAPIEDLEAPEEAEELEELEELEAVDDEDEGGAS